MGPIFAARTSIIAFHHPAPLPTLPRFSFCLAGPQSFQPTTSRSFSFRSVRRVVPSRFSAPLTTFKTTHNFAIDRSKQASKHYTTSVGNAGSYKSALNAITKDQISFQPTTSRSLSFKSIRRVAPWPSSNPLTAFRTMHNFVIDRLKQASEYYAVGNAVSDKPALNATIKDQTSLQIVDHKKSLLPASRTVTSSPSPAENPKSEIQETQQIIDGNLLELHFLPKILSKEQLSAIKDWMEYMKNLTYDDFDNRRGYIWDNCRLDTRDINSLRLLSIDLVKKFVTIQGVNVEQFPKSIFSYPNISQILLETILPTYFKTISQQKKLPDSIYLQIFVLRSLLSERVSTQKQHVRWHQDPSEYGTVADYTLVLMLSDPFDPLSGWEGGELLLKNGLPSNVAPAIRVVPKYNQAILFNNKKNSHMVTAIKNAKNHTTRDIIIINIYLEDPSL